MFEARVSKDTGLMWGRLLCGKPTGCSGRLGMFNRDYTPATMPPGFVSLVPFPRDFLDGEEALAAEQRHDYLDLELPVGFRLDGCIQTEGKSLQRWRLSNGARYRLQHTGTVFRPSRKSDPRRDDLGAGKPAPSRRRDLAEAVVCPVCGWPNLVDCRGIDTQLVRRYRALPYEVRALRLSRKAVASGAEEVWARPGWPYGEPPHPTERARIAAWLASSSMPQITSEDHYQYRAKGTPDAMWQPLGCRHWGSSCMLNDDMPDSPPPVGGRLGVPAWANGLYWEKGSETQSPVRNLLLRRPLRSNGPIPTRR